MAGDATDVVGYATTNPDFPNDTTENQWFDEAHFENYRALGQATGNAAEKTIREAVDCLMTRTGPSDCSAP